MQPKIHYFRTMGSVLVVAAMLAVPSLGTAQLDWSVVVDEATGIALSPLSDVEFDGVAVGADDTDLWVFDSQSGYDALDHWDGSTLTTFATEAELDSSGGASASYTSMTADNAGNLYGAWFGSSNTRIFRTPAGQPWSASVKMTADFDANNAFDIAVDEANSRLIFAIEDLFAVVDEDIMTVPLNANLATPTILVTEAVLQAAADLVPPSNDIDVIELAVQSDGTILASHGFSSDEEDSGTIIKVTPDGLTGSVFATPEQLIVAAGGTDAQDNIGQVHIYTLSNDSVIAHVAFVGGTNVNVTAPVILLGTPDGSSWSLLAAQSTVLADPDMSAFSDIGDVDFKNGDVDGDDNYYWTQQGPDGVIKMTITPPSAVDTWDLY